MAAPPHDVFAALADPTRWRVLYVARGARATATATLLARDLPVSRVAVVKHLAVLDKAGLRRGPPPGSRGALHGPPDPLDATARWLASIGSDWDDRLARIKRMAEKPAGD